MLSHLPLHLGLPRAATPQHPDRKEEAKFTHVHPVQLPMARVSRANQQSPAARRRELYTGSWAPHHPPTTGTLRASQDRKLAHTMMCQDVPVTFHISHQKQCSTPPQEETSSKSGFYSSFNFHSQMSHAKRQRKKKRRSDELELEEDDRRQTSKEAFRCLGIKPL